MRTSAISNSTARGLIPTAALAGALFILVPMIRATLPATSPTNLTVVIGSASYPVNAAPTAVPMTITASSPTTVLEWTNFSDGSPNGGTMGAGDSLTFSLPSSSAAILNDIVGGSATTLNGTIASTGKVYFLNPAGIAIGAGTAVNAAGFYVSTVPETLAYFEANGNLQAFSGSAFTAATTQGIAVASGATFATVGGTGTIGLAGSTVTLPGLATALTGNLYVDTQPTAAGTSGYSREHGDGNDHRRGWCGRQPDHRLRTAGT